MDQELWAHRAVPELPAAPSALWAATPADVGELTAHRARLQHVVADGPDGVGIEATSRLLLAFEELGSNALRHGRPPVQVTVATTSTGWVLDVTDAAVDRPPTPAVGRDPSRGGMGLHLIAQLAGLHGWDVAEGRKHVWACIAFDDDPTLG